METEDILMCPGPNEIADRVLRAMLHPAACPVYEEFQELYEQTLDMLAQAFQTTGQVVPIPGSGRSGLESAITSVVERGEQVDVFELFNGAAAQVEGLQRQGK